MADNRPTVCYIVVNDFWGGMSRMNGEPADHLFNSHPTAEAFPTSRAALKAVAVTVADGKRRRIRLASWKRDSFRVLRIVKARP
jgi:hypothetical protein